MLFVLIVLLTVVVSLGWVLLASPEKTGQIVVLRAERAENQPVPGAGRPSYGPWSHEIPCRCPSCR